MGKIKLKDADAQAAIQEQKERLEQRVRDSQKKITIATTALNETKLLTGQEWKDSKLAKLQEAVDDKKDLIDRIRTAHEPVKGYVPDLILVQRSYPRLTLN